MNPNYMLTPIRLALIAGLVWLTALWSMTHPEGIKQRVGQLLTLRGFLISILSISMFFQALGFLILPLPFLIPSEIALLGFGIFLLGLLLTSWAKLTMKENWGIPGQHDIAKQKRLVTTGPFAFSRNPIYVGLLLFFVGFELSLTSWLVVLVVPLIYLIRRAVWQEEKLLTKYFGQEYLRYASRVPRFF